MEIRDGVHTYPVDWQYGDLAVHVIHTDSHTVLFGSGVGDESDEQVLAIAHEHDVDAVIVEHGDMDHYSGVPALRDSVVDIEVAVPSDDAPTLWENDIEVDILMDPGESYFGVRAIEAPGHTPGNMAYLYDEVLVAGDTVVGVDSKFAAEDDCPGKLTVATARWNDDDEATRRSVGNLREYVFDVVLVSHGNNVLENGREEIDKLVAALGS